MQNWKQAAICWFLFLPILYDILSKWTKYNWQKRVIWYWCWKKAYVFSSLLLFQNKVAYTSSMLQKRTPRARIIFFPWEKEIFFIFQRSYNQALRNSSDRHVNICNLPIWKRFCVSNWHVHCLVFSMCSFSLGSTCSEIRMLPILLLVACNVTHLLCTGFLGKKHRF